MSVPNLPKTQLEAIRTFADEDSAHDFLVSLRWADGVTCPHCQSKEVGSLSVSKIKLRSGKESVRRVWNCKGCRKQFTAKVGTIFEDSALPLSKLLPSVWLICNAKNGISSCELARSVGITQKSAWFLLHRIRTAMRDHGGGMFSGSVESDESHIGGLAKNMHKNRRKQVIRGTGGAGKAIVHGLLERGKEGSPSQVRASVIPDGRQATLAPILAENIAPGSHLFTDMAAPYKNLHHLEHEFVHQMVDHLKEYVSGACHTNGLENFWSLLSRTLRGTYVNCAPVHLPKYVDEQVARFNERRDTDGIRFARTMNRVSNRRLTYRRLTGKDQPDAN